jgi:signal transduction histidine kinase
MPEEMSEGAQSLVNAMKLCTGFMSSIMNNLLDVRKMEEGKMVLKSTPIFLKDLMNSVHKMLKPSVRPAVKFINASITGGPEWALGDSHRMQQVLTNVVTNA